jgi:hypothetical protein
VNPSPRIMALRSEGRSSLWSKLTTACRCWPCVLWGAPTSCKCSGKFLQLTSATHTAAESFNPRAWGGRLWLEADPQVERFQDLHIRSAGAALESGIGRNPVNCPLWTA